MGTRSKAAHLELVADGHEILDVGDAVVRDLRDVEEAVAAVADVDKGAVRLDAAHRARDDVADAEVLQHARALDGARAERHVLLLLVELQDLELELPPDELLPLLALQRAEVRVGHKALDVKVLDFHDAAAEVGRDDVARQSDVVLLHVPQPRPHDLALLLVERHDEVLLVRAVDEELAHHARAHHLGGLQGWVKSEGLAWGATRARPGRARREAVTLTDFG